MHGAKNWESRVSSRILNVGANQFIEQEPGPRGSPHRPQADGPNCAGAALPEDAPTAKTESCFSSSWLAHDGQAGFVEPCTMASNR